MIPLTWRITAEEFAAYLFTTGKSAETVRTYVSNARLWYLWLLEREVNPRTGSRDLYVLFHGMQIKQGLAPATVRNRLHAVRAYYEWLGVTPNPTDGIKPPRSRPMPKRPVPIADQRRLVYGARSLRDEAQWRAMIDSGMRIGELVKMQIEDIDWPSNLCRLHGKGSKERDVWLSDETLGLIREYLAGRLKGPVWLTNEGKPMRRDGARQNFARLAKRQRVSAHPHQLRATFANEFLRAGGDLGALRVAMGHSDISTTAHYAAGTENERALSMMRALNLSGRLND